MLKLVGRKQEMREGKSTVKGIGETTRGRAKPGWVGWLVGWFLPAIMPETTVATTGVCVPVWTLARTRNRRPSSAIA